MTETSHYFVSTVRRGLATFIRGTASAANRAAIGVTLTPKARSMATQLWDRPASDTSEIPVQLYGPGDILGFDARVVTRTTPKADVGDFEPNYFPAVEFGGDMDFAWRFTASEAEEVGLMPWITLVVLIAESRGSDVRREFDDLPAVSRNLPQRIKLAIQGVLPELQFARLWSHVQVTAESGLGDDHGRVIEVVKREPERTICRLLCPRRLSPGVRYAAFVVPTFQLGRLAGLGQELEAGLTALEPSWQGNGDKDLELPYYYRWEFRTGQRGDFEHLVRLLEPRDLPGLGLRDMDCGAAGLGVRGVNRLAGPVLGLEGALRSIGLQPTDWGADAEAPSASATQIDIGRLINQPDDLLYADPEGGQGWFQILTPDVDVITDINGRLGNSGTEVSIRWETIGEDDGGTYGWIEYFDAAASEGTTFRLPPEPAAAAEKQFTQHHEVILPNLVPGRSYTFWIAAETSQGDIHYSSQGIFDVPGAVVPPIYGRWHRGRSMAIDPSSQEEWIDVLNLDPRHRAAAGLGAEVIRKQQEPLMASAWDQLGAIDEANDILRRAQFGREALIKTYRQIGEMHTEDFLAVTAPVQKRVVVETTPGGSRVTATRFVSSRTRIPAAALDPAFRHIARRRGPIRKRQQAATARNLLTRLASGELEPAGPPREPLGIVRICDISARLQNSVKPTIELSAEPATAGVGETVRLRWSSRNGNSCSLSWSSRTDTDGEDEVVPFPSAASGSTGSGGAGLADGELVPGGGLGQGELLVPDIRQVTFAATCQGAAGIASASVVVSRIDVATTPSIRVTGSLPAVGSRVAPTELSLRSRSVNRRRMLLHATPLRTPPAQLSRSGTRSRSRGLMSRLASTVAPRPGEITRTRGPSFRPVEPVYGGGVRLHSVDWGAGYGTPTVPPGRRFCDGKITPARLDASLADDPFGAVKPEYDPSPAAESAKQILEHWLDVPAISRQRAPVRDASFLEQLRQDIFAALDPSVTVLTRTARRLRLRGSMNMRFGDGFGGDPLDSIMWAPDFKQPMYEPLRDLSHALLLPGVEKIPQNTISLLETNRRFVESYMCGLNHEFAGELLWREYPTDQRGSYFRQFWDVSVYVLQDQEAASLFQLWKSKVGIGMTPLADVDIELKKRVVIQDMKTAAGALADLWLDQNDVSELPESNRLLINRFFDEDASAVDQLPTDVLDDLVRAVGIRDRLDEKLRDITRLTAWANNALGRNKPSVDPQSEGSTLSTDSEGEDSLVLVIRGDLLKRYPNASIYSVDAVIAPNGRRLPRLSEYLDDALFEIDSALMPSQDGAVPAGLRTAFEENGVTLAPTATVEDTSGENDVRIDGGANTFELRNGGNGSLKVFWLPDATLYAGRREFPVFKATLPPDLTFFGFAFKADDARAATDQQTGKYFVIEEPIGEPRFGLDVPSDGALNDWPDLSWTHFGLEEEFGTYLDNHAAGELTPIQPGDSEGPESWTTNMSAAERALLCFQKPVRIIVHANQMLPPSQHSP